MSVFKELNKHIAAGKPPGGAGTDLADKKLKAKL
jgi:hypothetical protein